MSKGCQSTAGQGTGDQGIIEENIEKSWYLHCSEDQIKLEKALVRPVATYGCGSWTMKKYEEDRLNVFEMKALRQILRVSWIQKRTNAWVLEKTGVKRELFDTAQC